MTIAFGFTRWKEIFMVLLVSYIAFLPSKSCAQTSTTNTIQVFEEEAPPPTPKYPFDETIVKQISASLRAIPKFKLGNIYYGHNNYFITCISGKIPASAKYSDSSFLKSLHTKIANAIPASDVSIRTLLFVGKKPVVITGGQKDYAEFRYCLIDSLTASLTQLLPEVQQMLATSNYSQHQVEKIFIGISLANMHYRNQVLIQTRDQMGKNFFIRYQPSKKIGKRTEKGFIRNVVSLTPQPYGFSGEDQVLVRAPNVMQKRALKYLTANKNDFVEKDLSSVSEYMERYSEYYIRIY